MKKPSKTIPKFKNEKEERTFWERHDASEYFDLSKAVRVTMPNLKPSTASISLRLSQSFLENIKLQANKIDVPYQSLMKIWLAEKLEEATK
ncbi:BrnA antitoxin family protein [Polynucleobacter sp. JS-Safj-400b-B2]|jgi:predicted DNA binding CopG/RHH family protein|uniref:BrnA antitoxin family protein n=1 Tax=Polynucleobacter sp. JS-Safj-400b-B2 TaxID=2576921 RepID=UPI001C0D4CE6|nr:BrnA antitoxin family protein [Polynucleobacter sp. JS-Safj-400b-B2]MBU3625069.1 BrnA antitoxin family protein [Polynucleobacter sp. JS-Safj-400b-B2]